MIREPGYTIAKSVLLPWLRFCFRGRIEGERNIPSTGATIIAVNHISPFDPLAVALAVVRAGRRPRFFAKSSLFRIPVIGWILRSARQIPVRRGTAAAPESLEAAERALKDGEAIIIFPEGTLTKREDLRPSPARNGVARLAMASGLPVIPCATWGGQWIWSRFVGFRPGLKKRFWVRFGEPIHFAPGEMGPEMWDAVTQKIMQRIEEMTESLRDEAPWPK